jgi:hypothetical protein
LFLFPGIFAHCVYDPSGSLSLTWPEILRILQRGMEAMQYRQVCKNQSAVNKLQCSMDIISTLRSNRLRSTLLFPRGYDSCGIAVDSADDPGTMVVIKKMGDRNVFDKEINDGNICSTSNQNSFS